MIAPETLPDDGSFDNQLNLPESGNGIPDILDEALWAISFYLEHQYPDGAIPLGRVNLSDGGSRISRARSSADAALRHHLADA